MEATTLNPKAAWPFPPTREEIRNAALEEAARLIEVEFAASKDEHRRLQIYADHIRALKRQ